jgi:hypothetical protein
MLWPRTAGELAWSASSAWEALPRARRSGCRPAIEDWFAALQPRSSRRRRRSLRSDRRFIHGSRSGLRHHHAPRYGYNGFCAACGLGGDCANRACRSSGTRRNARRGGSLLGRRCGRCRRITNRWSTCGRWLDRNLFVARTRSRGRFCDACRRRCYNNNRPRNNYCACRCLGDNGPYRWARSDGRRGRRRCDNRRRGAGLRNDLARFRPCWNCSSGLRGNRSRWLRCGCFRLHRRNYGRLRRAPRVARLFLFFLLLGQQSLHHISGLGDVRQIDLGDNSFSAMAARCGAGMRRVLRFPRKVRTNLLSLVQLQRTGVRLASRYADFRKNLENRARLYFQLFREIIDSNLTHPPLFNLCRQMALKNSLLPLGPVRCQNTCCCTPDVGKCGATYSPPSSVSASATPSASSITSAEFSASASSAAFSIVSLPRTGG